MLPIADCEFTAHLEHLSLKRYVEAYGGKLCLEIAR